MDRNIPPPSYREVCRIVGELYLQSRNESEVLENGVQALTASNAQQVQSLQGEIAQLKAELQQLRNGKSP